MVWFCLPDGRNVYMVRFWNRLINMSNDKQAKQVFVWDYQLCKTGHLAQRPFQRPLVILKILILKKRI